MAEPTPNKIDVEIETKDGTKVKLVVQKPGYKEVKAADLAYDQEYMTLLRQGYLVTEEVRQTLEKRGLWDGAKDERLEQIEKEIKKNTKVFLGQVEGTTLDQARTAAVTVRKLHAERAFIRSRWSELESKTAEFHAGERRFNELVVRCTYKQDGKSYYKSLEDYQNRPEDPAREKVLEAMSKFVYGLDPDWFQKRPDTAWLIANDFADEKGRLIRKDGKFVDAEGNLVDEEGRRTNEQGQLIDADGEPVDEKGLPLGPTYAFVGAPTPPSSATEPAQESTPQTNA